MADVANGPRRNRADAEQNDARLPFQAWAESLPVCTRVWTLGIIATSVLVQCQVLTPFQLYFSLNAVFEKGQYWRILSSFFYFGPLSLDLLFHVYFVQRYCRLLEASPDMSFIRFSWMLFVSMVALLALSPVFKITFLGQSLSNVLVYIWGRKNPDNILSLMGFFHVRASVVPFVFLVFNTLMFGSVQRDDLAGIVVGHGWYFFNDLFPFFFDQRPLDIPDVWSTLMTSISNRTGLNMNRNVEEELAFLDNLPLDAHDIERARQEEADRANREGDNVGAQDATGAATPEELDQPLQALAESGDALSRERTTVPGTGTEGDPVGTTGIQLGATDDEAAGLRVRRQADADGQIPAPGRAGQGAAEEEPR